MNDGAYVFVCVEDASEIDRSLSLFEFKEKEGVSLVIEKSKADKLNLAYKYVASWITIEIHSSLEAVGLTALFSSELAKHQIGCNVVAAYYHDHIFVDKKDSDRALQVLKDLSKNYK